MNFKSATVVSLVLSAAALYAADFTDVTVRQRWPWSQKLDVSYTLVTEKARHVSLALYSNDTRLAIPDAALSGDIWNVAPGGVRVITVDPAKTAYTNQVLANVRAELTAGEEPLYMIVDLTKSLTDTNQITYLTAYDLTNSASTYKWEKGSFYHTGTNIDAAWQDTVVWTSVTNDRAYWKSKFVLRYIPAGSFTMGSPESELPTNGYSDNVWNRIREQPRKVTLTKGCFAGIFPLTGGQRYQFSGIPLEGNWYWNAEGDAALLPAWNSMDQVRGCWKNEQGVSQYDWPSNGHAVSPTSILGILREKTGISFDLPTEAQWEYACRAGTTGAWNNGTTITNQEVDLELDNLGWYRNNAAVTTGQGYMGRILGLKRPNGWGLFDMNGDTLETCLDWWPGEVGTAYAPTGEVDPVGPASGNLVRLARGGSFDVAATRCRSGARSTVSPSNIFNSSYRLFWTLP